MVLDDVADYILLQGFSRQEDIRGEKDIANRIQKTLNEQREREFYQMDSEDRKLPEIDPRELGKVEDKKRKFLNEFRPH